jgi:hypothetical protein
MEQGPASLNVVARRSVQEGSKRSDETWLPTLDAFRTLAA